MADPNVRFLAPQKLETEPGAQGSQIAFKHWKKTFDHFLAMVELNTPTGKDTDKFGLLGARD